MMSTQVWTRLLQPVWARSLHVSVASRSPALSSSLWSQMGVRGYAAATTDGKPDFKLLKELRRATAAPLGDCRAALMEAGNDYEAATALLLAKGHSAQARQGRVSAQGSLSAAARGPLGVLVEVCILVSLVLVLLVGARTLSFRLS
jgi:hypothetical protein